MNPDTPHLRPHLPPDLPADQIDRIQLILDRVLTYLRSRSRTLPPEADLAVTYNLKAEADRS